MTKKIKDLLNIRAEKIKQAEDIHDNAEKQEEFTKIVNEIKEIDEKIKVEKDFADAQKGFKIEEPPKNKAVFNAGLFFNAVKNMSNNTATTEQREYLNEIQGINGTKKEEGAFAIPSDWGGQIMDRVMKENPLLAKVNFRPLSGNTITFWKMDKDSKSRTPVQAYWMNEGEPLQKSNLKMKQQSLKVEKLGALVYITDEMLEDASFLEATIEEECQKAISEKIEEALTTGDGVAKPLGILNSNNKALIKVATTTTKANVISGKDIINMESQCLNLNNSFWFAHPDIKPFLPELTLTGEKSDNFLFKTAGGTNVFPYDTINGRQVIYSDECSELGTFGDINLIDMSYYMGIKKGQVRQDWSMHVEFLTDQQAFRIIFRLNAQPTIESAFTIKNSTKKRSPFVTLATRS